MTEQFLIWGQAIVVGGLITLAFLCGYHLREIREELQKLARRQPEPPKPMVVTPLPPGYANVTRSSAVVTPKSPAQVEREEEMRLQDLLK